MKVTAAVNVKVHSAALMYSCKLIASMHLFSLSPTQTQASKTMVRVHRGQTCQACQEELTEAFTCTVGGELLHTSCVNTHNH